ncbi:hypothetical protein TNCV_3995301 [Trichonephila clavipes]|nr:hypothetical protein TNCV_3995301 [Trichonephila clavipes]
MKDSRGDTRRALIGSNVGNPCYFGGYTNPFDRDNVGILSESSEFLHVAHSLKSVSSSLIPLISSGKCFSFVGFNERRIHGRPHIILMSEWIVDKRRSETCTSCCLMCLHKRPPNTIDAFTVQCQYRSDFINHLHDFNCSICRCTGTVGDPLGHINSFTFLALHDSLIWCYIGTIRLLLGVYYL